MFHANELRPARFETRGGAGGRRGPPPSSRAAASPAPPRPLPAAGVLSPLDENELMTFPAASRKSSVTSWFACFSVKNTCTPLGGFAPAPADPPPPPPRPPPQSIRCTSRGL